MIIRARIVFEDSGVEIKLFDTFAKLDEYIASNKGRINRIDARTILPGEMRQGRALA